MKRALLVVVILLLPSTALLIFKQALGPARTPGPLATTPPSAPGSAQPRLTVSPRGVVLLSWVEPEPSGGHRLRFSTLGETEWSAASTIARGDDWFVNWADFPSVTAVDGGFWAAHWLVRSGPGTYDYDIHLAFSRDGGATWSEPAVPHRADSGGEHGFVSATPHQGGLAMAWLDGSSMGDPPSGSMNLRFARFGADGEPVEQALLDERVCDCCQTAIAALAEGLIVAYRDRSADEIRDVSAVRQTGGRWDEPAPVGEDGWRIAGCPVNGPAISAAGETVAVAWHTEASGGAKTLVAFSTDRGETFSDPIRIDLGDSNGRVDVELLGSDTAAASWLEGDRFLARRVTRGGELGLPVTLAHVGSSRKAGFPQMAVRSDEAVFAWTETSTETTTIAAARLPLDRLP